MSKIGIALPGAVTLLGGVSIYGYKPSLSDYRKRQNLTYLPGETGRMPSDSPTNLAWLAQVPTVAGCVGISQTFTTTGTFTASCTGTLTMQAWGLGSSTPASSNYYSGSGGGAFAGSPAISVTNGQTWLANVPAAQVIGSTTKPTFICPTGVATCVTTIRDCNGYAGLDATNMVCAANGVRATINSTGGNGGSTANSLGVVLFKGGKGGNGSFTTPAGGGGSGGPDGAGADGASNAGGNGDAGSGGAGGNSAGSAGGNNVNGGGGGGANTYPGTGGAGGVPGGGSGGSGGGAVTGSRGQIIIHSDASDVLSPVLNIGSGYGGGTISSA